MFVFYEKRIFLENKKNPEKSENIRNKSEKSGKIQTNPKQIRKKNGKFRQNMKTSEKHENIKVTYKIAMYLKVTSFYYK